MNVRQAKYKKNVISGMSKYNAARAAGYSENTARSRTKELDQRVSMPDVMERYGLTDKFLTERLTELLLANKVVGYLHNYKKSDKVGAEVEKVQPDEIISNEFVEVPDWSARAKGIELVGKFSGKLRDKVEHAVDIRYTEMRRIQIEAKPMELNLGEIPDNLRERNHD